MIGLLVNFIRTADEAAPERAEDSVPESSCSTLVETHKPEELLKKLAFSLPSDDGQGRDGFLKTIESVLKYSVNTWDQGFLDKLYSSTTPVSQHMRTSEMGLEE